MTDQDNDHLRLLSIFHYVVGAFGFLFSCLPMIHVAVGIAMISSPSFLGTGSGTPPPPIFGWLFIVMGSVFVVIGMAMSLCIFLSGRHIAERRNYLFSFVVACFECMFFPFGTALGVCTIVVLSRTSVKDAYQSIEASRRIPTASSS